MKWIAALVMLTVAFVALADDSEDYFPRVIGNSWTHEDSTVDGIDTTVSVVVGTDTMLGYETWITENTDADGTDSSYTQFRTDGVYILVTLLDSLVEGNQALKMAPPTVDVGDSWTALDFDTAFSQSGIDINLDIDIQMEVLGRDDITVPAGFFPNCLRIYLVSNFSYVASMGGTPLVSGDGVQGRDTMWAAQHVGTVMDRSIEYEIDFMTGEIVDSSKSRTILLDYDFTGVTESAPLPEGFSLETCPNPFNAAVSISAPDGAEINVFDLNGRSVAEITAYGSESAKPSSTNASGACRWTPDESVGSGVYLVRATVGGISVTKRVAYLK